MPRSIVCYLLVVLLLVAPMASFAQSEQPIVTTVETVRDGDSWIQYAQIAGLSDRDTEDFINMLLYIYSVGIRFEDDPDDSWDTVEGTTYSSVVGNKYLSIRTEYLYSGTKLAHPGADVISYVFDLDVGDPAGELSTFVKVGDGLKQAIIDGKFKLVSPVLEEVKETEDMLKTFAAGYFDQAASSAYNANFYLTETGIGLLLLDRTHAEGDFWAIEAPYNEIEGLLSPKLLDALGIQINESDAEPIDIEPVELVEPTAIPAETLLNETSMPTSPASSDSAEKGISKLPGGIESVDKYGNVYLTITSADAEAFGLKVGDVVLISFDKLPETHAIIAPVGTAYSDVDTGNVVLRDRQGGSETGLIVAINMGDFSAAYGVGEGDGLAISVLFPGGYLEEYNLRKATSTRTNERADYESDESFANFRVVETTGMKQGLLYRSSSPVNNEIGRASYANALAEAAGIKTVVNLADSDEAIKGYFEAEGFSSGFYKSLYDAGQVVALDMGVDFTQDVFKSKLAEGLRFIINNDGPFLIHCNEGKERAGFTLLVLEALVGASVDEMVADHMQSFVNYYDIEPGTESYKSISESNAINILHQIAGADMFSSIDEIDFVHIATYYLTEIGLSTEEIDQLKVKLSAE
ncbi:hypothetical protein FACS18948_2450 [Clostridia bacterium]|nr:hypothetical protein FACS18948_2450 [Clostridia bacterium]